MQPSPASHLAALAAAASLLVGACALDDGRPWGLVELDLAASFEVPASRLVDGRLKTARNYLVRVDAVELEVDAVTLTQQAGGAAMVFDPADPPPGYSLCHNGHCHHVSGALVDYEDIILELAGAGGATGASVTIGALAATVSVPLGARAAIPLAACGPGAPGPDHDGLDPCAFGRGALGTLRVTIGALRVSGVVFDELTGDAARLGPDGRAFSVALEPPSSDPTAAIAAAFGKDEPFGVRLAAILTLPAGWFDGVDWAELPEADLASALDDAFGERAELALTIRHFD